MSCQRIVSSKITLRLLLITVVCPHLLPAAHAQQFVSNDPAPWLTCPAAPALGDSCDARAVAALASTGQAFVQNQMGTESALVLEPGQTIREAHKSLERAARKGNPAAQVNLAVLYLNGWGAEKNYGTALYWFKAAAQQGNPQAHANLGILYLNGVAVRQDYGEAMLHFQYASEHGETAAMVNLGYLYDSGLGTARNPAEAVRWYRLAAEQGNALGQNNLADMYLRGLGVTQSDVLALQWFSKAAQQGNNGARIKLGYMYASGRASRVDLETAYAWIYAAQLAGDHRGDSYLQPLESQLTPEQLTRAKQRAQQLLSTQQPAKVELAFVR